MSILPKQDFPIYSITLPVSKQEIKIRPYVVKEQKLLLMAVESKDEKSIIDTISQIVSNCVVSSIDTTQLPGTDVEYIFYQLRARSQSEHVELVYRCENVIEDDICGGKMYHRLNLLTDLEVTEPLSRIIKITDKIGVKLNHQKFEYVFVKGDKLTPQEEFENVAKNIEFIYDENSSYTPKDVPLTEIVDWLENLSTSQYSQIGDFFLNEPKIHKKIDLTCKKCGMNHHLEVEDIFDFFI